MKTHGTSRYVTLDGLRLHYVDWNNGERTPMVLLHGLRAYARWFDDLAQVFRDRRWVLALDQRGRGGSDWAKNGDYTRRAYVSDLEGFLDALGIRTCILVGHSLGALNAIHYTARNPERVLALVDLDVGPEIAPAGIRRILGELAATPPDFDSWEEARRFLSGQHPSASDESLRTRLEWMLRESPGGRIAWRIDPAIFDPDTRPDPPEETWAILERIECPTLIVRGGASDVLSVETCEKMVRLIPRSRWVEIPDAGHMVMEDAPETVSAAVEEFLSEVG